MTSEPVMRFIPDPKRFPMQGQPNVDRSNFWGFNAMCLRRMLEDIGFEVKRSNVRDDRVFIDATRTVFDNAEVRLGIAYGSVRQVAVNGCHDDSDAWRIF